MPWTLETYNKAEAIGSPSNLATCMYELLRAVQQRQEIAGLTVTTNAIRGNGTLGAIADATDFKDLPIINWHPVTEAPTSPGLTHYNLVDVIQAGILALIDSGKFVQASGKSTVIDRDWVSAQIGRDIEAEPVTTPGAATAVLNANYWQGLQDALDLLIYLKLSVDFELTEENSPDAAAYRFQSFGQDTLEDAWDTMVGASADVDNYWDVPGILQRTQWFVFYNSVDYFASRQYFQGFEIEVPAQEGTLTHACYRGSYYARYCSLDEIEIQIGDAPGTLDLTVFPSPITPAQAFTTDGFSPTISDTVPTILTFDTAITTALPASSPLSPLAGVGNEGQVFFSVGGLDLYFDLASLLEDQA